MKKTVKKIIKTLSCIVVVFVLLIIVYLALLMWGFEKSSDYYYSEAQKLENEGKYKEAIELLDKAIEENPQNIYALMNRAVDKSLLGDYEGAIEDYSRIIKIDERNTLAFLNRGMSKAELKDYKGAIEDYDKGIETKGGEFMYFEKAENSFINSGYEFDALMEELRFERGFARTDIGMFRGAFDDFNFCIQKNFYLSTSYYMLGVIYIENEHIDEACEMFAKAKELGNSEAQGKIDVYCKK